MKKITANTFSKGLNMDLNPLSTPKDVLTDCINGTIITYNGDEFTLQTDQGNVKVFGSEGSTALPTDFIPLGMKEYDGVIYIVAHNPFTKETQVGSLPAPQRYVSFRSETDGLTKYLSGLDNNLFEDTNHLKSSININHNMNLLNAYLVSGDKYMISIGLNNINTTGNITRTQILSKLINKYQSISDLGYFDFQYYTMDEDGILTPININLLSDIRYTSELESGNEKTFVYSENSKGVVSLVIKSSSISTFDFNLSSDISVFNTDQTLLRGKITFDPNLITTDSAIIVKTIKVDTVITENGVSTQAKTKYFDYTGVSTSQLMYITKYSDDGSTLDSFIDPTVLAVTCTPIDQFGRELTDKAITKSSVLTAIKTSTDAHSIFRYIRSSDQSSIDILFDFLYKGPTEQITTVNIEFYDFWSDITFVIPNITLDSNRQASITVPLQNFTTNLRVFNDSYRGGIPISYVRDYSGTFVDQSSLRIDKIIGSSPKKELYFGTDSTLPSSKFLRNNHCYIARIFGIEGDKEYDVIQLLYTNGVFNSYSSESNFGAIDILDTIRHGSLGVDTRYDFQTSVSGIIGNGTNIITQSSIVENSIVDNYSSSLFGGSQEYLFRLFGGPVFYEWDVIEDSTSVGTKYTEAYTDTLVSFRNIYDNKSYISSNLASSGYHTICEMDLMLGYIDSSSNTRIGIDTSSYIINDSYTIIGGLRKAGSLKNFTFDVIINYTLNFSNQTGSITLSSDKLFGIVDGSLFKKKLTIKNEVLSNSTAYSATKNYTNNISFTPSWTNSYSPLFSPTQQMNIDFSLDTVDNVTTLNLNNINLSTQRFITSKSSFGIYNINKLRTKSWKYFTDLNLFCINTLRVKIDNISDISYRKMYIGLGYISQKATSTTDFNRFHLGFTTFFSDPFGPSNPSEMALIGYTTIIPNAVTTISGVVTQRYGAKIQYTRVNIPFLNSIGPFVTDIDSVKETQDKVSAALDISSSANSLQNIYEFILPLNPVYSSYTSNYTVSAGSLPIMGSILRCKVDSSNFEYVVISYTAGDISPLFKNVTIKQNYRETIISQNADPSTVNYNDSSSISELILNNNKLEYYISTSNLDNASKYICKICYGDSTLVPMSIDTMNSVLINKWIGGIIPGNINLSDGTTKLLYNFLDNSLSIGNTKNIPYTFQNNILSVQTNIKTLDMKGTPQINSSIIGYFNNAQSFMESSSYLLSDSDITPLVRIVDSNNIFHSANSKLTTYTTSNAINLGSSGSISIPCFNIPAFSPTPLRVDGPWQYVTTDVTKAWISVFPTINDLI